MTRGSSTPTSFGSPPGGTDVVNALSDVGKYAVPGISDGGFVVLGFGYVQRSSIFERSTIRTWPLPSRTVTRFVLGIGRSAKQPDLNQITSARCVVSRGE